MKKVIRAARGRDFTPRSVEVVDTNDNSKSISDMVRDALAEASTRIFGDKDAVSIHVLSPVGDEIIATTSYRDDDIIPAGTDIIIKLPQRMETLTVDAETKSSLEYLFEDKFEELVESRYVVPKSDFAAAERFIKTSLLKNVTRVIDRISSEYNIDVSIGPYPGSYNYLGQILNKYPRWSQACAVISVDILTIDGHDVFSNKDRGGYRQFFFGFAMYVPLDNFNVCTDNLVDSGLIPVEDFVRDKFDEIVAKYNKVASITKQKDELVVEASRECEEFERTYADKYSDLFVDCEGYQTAKGQYGVIITVRCYDDQIAFKLKYSSDQYADIDLESKIKNAIKYRRRRDGIR